MATWQGMQKSDGDDYDAMVKRLKRGTWIEFEQESGESTRVKLAWVSPLKGLYLFTDRLGEKAVSITPAGLARKLRSGRAQIIEDIALVDRAVNNLMDRLKQAAYGLQARRFLASWRAGQPMPGPPCWKNT